MSFIYNQNILTNSAIKNFWGAPYPPDIQCISDVLIIFPIIMTQQ